MTNPIAREDMVEWLRPFLEHAGIPLMRVLSVHFGTRSIEVTLVDGEPGDCPNGRTPQWQPLDYFDEFAMAQHVIDIPLKERVEIEADEALAVAAGIPVEAAAYITDEARLRFGLSPSQVARIADLLAAGGVA